MKTEIKMSFEPEIAKELGTDAAIILSNIKFWEQTNQANDINKHDGRYWTYNSINAFCKLFPYLSKSKIRTCLKNLEEQGYIESGNYNKSSYDRTKWYTTTTENTCADTHTTICQNSQMELSDSTNRFAGIDEPIPDNKHRYINTDNKITTSNSEKEFSEGEEKSSELKKSEEKSLSKVAQKVFPKEVREVTQACIGLFDEYLRPSSDTELEKWRDTVDKLMRIDGVSPREIYRLTKCAREDDFWSQNFLSLNKLRSKNKDNIKYIVVFHEKFKPKSQKINRQTQETIINNSKGW